MRPLWQLLLNLKKRKPAPLTCEECFDILEYLATNGLPQNPEERQSMIRLAKQHLATCPNCENYYQKRLEELETQASKLTNLQK